MPTPQVKIIASRAVTIRVTLVDAQQRVQSVPDSTPCTLVAGPLSVDGTATAGVAAFSVTAEDMTAIAAGRYIGDVRVDLEEPINTERFYLDVVEPIA